MKHLFYFVVILVLLPSCGRGKTENSSKGVEEIVIDLSQDDFYSDGSAFKSFNYVKLETTDGCLLDELFKVICEGDRIYALSLIEPTVFIFNAEGKFLSKIKIGQGPGEVLFVSDMNVKDGKLYVLDMYKTLKEYDSDGNFIQDKYKFDMNYFSFFFVSSGIYLTDPNTNANSDYNVHFYSESGQEKSFLEKKDWARNFRLMTSGCWKGEYFTWPLSNVIYKINSQDDLVPYISVNFMGKGVTDREFEKPLDNYNIRDDEVFAWWLKDYIPMNDGFFFSFKYEELYYVKKKGDLTAVYANLVEGLPSLGSSVGCKDNMLIFALPSYKLLAEREDIAKDGLGLMDIYKEDVSETDNPILVFVPIQ